MQTLEEARTDTQEALLDKMLRDLKVAGLERELGPYMTKHVALHLLYQGWARA